MGKQPDTGPQLLWWRVRPGYHHVTADGTEYTARRIRPRDWELTGTRDTTAVLHTWGDSLHALRVTARRFHHAHRARWRADTGDPTMAAIIQDSILSALRLRRSRFTLTNEGNGWLAAYTCKLPAPAPQLQFMAFKQTSTEALNNLDVQLRAALAPGGDLHAEYDETCGTR